MRKPSLRLAARARRADVDLLGWNPRPTQQQTVRFAQIEDRPAVAVTQRRVGLGAADRPPGGDDVAADLVATTADAGTEPDAQIARRRSERLRHRRDRRRRDA